MRILRWISIVLVLGAAGGAGFFYWQKSRPRAVPVSSVPDEEKRAAVIYDSLGIVDFEIRQAQESQDSVPQALIEEHARLWARYTDLRSRLASLADDSSLPPETREAASLAEAPHVSASDSTVLSAASPSAMSPVEGFLRLLTGWIWGIAGLAALILGIFLWLLLRKSRTPREAVSFPKARTLRESLAPWETPNPATREPVRDDIFETAPEPVRNQVPETPYRPSIPALPVPDGTLPQRTVDPTFAASSWENTRTTPPASAVEPSAMQDMILSLSKRGHTPAEIARRLRLPQDQVSLILKLRQAL